MANTLRSLSLLCSMRPQTRSPRHPHRGTCSAPSRAGAAFPGSGCRNHRQDRALRRAPASQKAANSTKLLAGPQHPSLPGQDLETQKTPSSFSSHAHTSTALRTSSTPPIKLFSNAQPRQHRLSLSLPWPEEAALNPRNGHNRALNPQAWNDIQHPHSPPAPGHVRTPTSHARHPRIGSARSRCRTPGRIGSDAQCVF